MWRPAAEQSAAESAAAESMERRAGTKGNASQQSTCRAQSRISVSQAPDRMRQLLAVWTRGGSRMRESRTYGSVRGACDETHVPTATSPPVHRAVLLGLIGLILSWADGRGTSDCADEVTLSRKGANSPTRLRSTGTKTRARV